MAKGAGRRRPFVGGNWKMNGDRQLVERMFGETLAGLGEMHAVDVVVAPPFPYLFLAGQLAEAAAGAGASIQVAAQNAHQKLAGAYTGEVSVATLRDVGISWVILGHSERRTLFGETDEMVREKVATALAAGLNVILCVGESGAERERDATVQVISRQLDAVLPALQDEKNTSITAAKTEQHPLASRLVLAYEPVWAIGTGKVATPSQAQQVHAQIRHWLGEHLGPQAQTQLRIIYGGSVTASNCGELAELPDVDGFLVGGASLKPEFRQIVAAAAQP